MVYQILALFIWSSAFVAAKYTFTMMDTILMIQVRLFMAAIIVMPLFFRRWKGVSKPMRKQLWWLGFFNYTATRSRDPTDSAPTVPAVVRTLHFHSQYGRRVSSPVLSVC